MLLLLAITFLNTANTNAQNNLHPMQLNYGYCPPDEFIFRLQGGGNSGSGLYGELELFTMLNETPFKIKGKNGQTFKSYGEAKLTVASGKIFDNCDIWKFKHQLLLGITLQRLTMPPLNPKDNLGVMNLGAYINLSGAKRTAAYNIEMEYFPLGRKGVRFAYNAEYHRNLTGDKVPFLVGLGITNQYAQIKRGESSLERAQSELRIISSILILKGAFKISPYYGTKTCGGTITFNFHSNCSED